MDHTKCINDVLNKYSDFPSIQSDMRKLLKYTESQFRMFLTPIIKNENLPMSEDRYNERADRFRGDLEAEAAFKNITKLISTGITDPDAAQKIKSLLDSVKHRPELVSAVQEAGQLCVAVVHETLAQSAALKGGVSNG